MAKRSPIFTSGRRVQASVAGTWKSLHDFPLSPSFEHLLPSDMDRFFLNDFKPLYILDFYVMDRFVSHLTTLGVKCN